ncbi:MAG: phage tail sheath subtilisin-like domain-containing protein [Clostridia bacterium]|nr:phage tail sheath subtilisin-like domain-containing protein [Clostridia bacterium]
MALGGGGFTAQNKVLPGAYINFVSANIANATIAERGLAGIAVTFGSGATGTNPFYVMDAAEFYRSGAALFGLAATSDDYIAIAEILAHASRCVIFNLGSVDSEDAATQHAGAMSVFQTQGVNAVAVTDNTNGVPAAYIAWAKSCRDDYGIKLQVVIYHGSAIAANATSVPQSYDSIAVIDCEYEELVPWVAGYTAGLYAGRSALHKVYDGQIDLEGTTPIYIEHTQASLAAIETAGIFTVHRVGADFRVLADINSMITDTATQDADVFKQNSVIRTIDTIAASVAAEFADNYLGAVPNDDAGRASFKQSVLDILEDLSDIRAIEVVDPEEVAVSEGSSPENVVVDCVITVTGVMAKVYMTCNIA